MAETFYSALGVESDADAEAIRDAFRAKVKETHPDVSDDDDAASTFKRLTAARDVLLDENSRQRYDRVGHTAYVRRHLDSAAWSVDETGSATGAGEPSGTGSSGSSTGGAGGSSGRSTGTTGAGSSTGASANGSGASGSTGSGSNGGGSSRRGSTSSTSATGSTGSRGRRGSRSGSTAENHRRYRSNHGETNGPETGATGGGTDGDHGTWSTDAGQDWAFSGGSTTSTATGGHGADPRQRARADGWEAAHAATNAYTPSGFEPAASPDDVGAMSQREALRRIGPWLAFHFVFLISAFVTVWLLLTWVPSVPTLFASLLLLGGTVFFSILHLVSQVYS